MRINIHVEREVRTANIRNKAKKIAYIEQRNSKRLESWEIIERDWIRNVRRNLLVDFKKGFYLPITPYGSINEICEND